MSFIKWLMIFEALIGIAVGLYLFFIGSLGLADKRPQVFPARRSFWFMIGIFAVVVLLMLDLFFENWDNLEGSLTILYLFQTLVLAVVVFFFWRQMSGYTILGISDETFREALTSALVKLNLPYQEGTSGVRLTSLNADLQATVVSWMSVARIQIKQPQHAHYTRVVADAMKDYYARHSDKVNYLPFIIYVLMGIFLIVFILIFLVGGAILQST